MTYEFNRKASQEAEARALDNEKLVRVRSQVQAMVGEMAPDGVRGHKIGFHRQAWGGLEDVLTSEILERQEITRGEVFAIAEEVRSGARPPTHLLAASFLWGSGTTGYGAARWNKIIEAGEEQIEGALTRGLAEAQEDPIAGYTAFFGGTEWDQRENPFTKPWLGSTALGRPSSPRCFTSLRPVR